MQIPGSTLEGRGGNGGKSMRNDLSVRTCVGRSVCPALCGITADRIQMSFGIIGRTGPGMRQVVGFHFINTYDEYAVIKTTTLRDINNFIKMHIHSWTHRPTSLR